MIEHPNRKSTRLAGFDYSSAGMYFITLVTHERRHLFGEIITGEMILNDFGKLAASEWLLSGQIRQEIELDEWCIMPNHFHGIILLKENKQRGLLSGTCVNGIDRKPKSLGSLVAGFKSSVTHKINERRGTPGIPVWQRNYYDHIIRDEEDLNRIQEYIINNPLKWEIDREYSDR